MVLVLLAPVSPSSFYYLFFTWFYKKNGEGSRFLLFLDSRLSKIDSYSRIDLFLKNYDIKLKKEIYLDGVIFIFFFKCAD
jgi:hypothetical protein